MAYKEIDLSVFPPEREESLKAVYRYNMFETMYYRSNLWQHEHRVSWIIELLLPLCEGIALDPEKARILALVHDDAETLTGDIQAGHKMKMSSTELANIDSAEEQAAEELSRRYPKEVHGYNYLELLKHAIYKDCPEAQLVSYADRFDAYCESMHEVYAGNFSLVWSWLFYERWSVTYEKKYSALTPLLSQDSPLIINNVRQQPMHVDSAKYTHFGKPHTRESIRVPTEFPYYNTWREMILEYGKEEGERFLTEQREGK